MQIKSSSLGFYLVTMLAMQVLFASSLTAQNPVALTPLQLEIEKQRTRLSSTDVEERRDALTRLGWLHDASASRVAVPALNDPLPIIRATAVASVISLPASESSASLIPLLADKDDFVRREAAYALGKTKSRTAVARLAEVLISDKDDGVRGAAAVALGEIGDAAAAVPLSLVLNPQPATPSKKKKKLKGEQNPFVQRAAARALGQIGDRAGTPALVMVLQNEAAGDDLRREAAEALGRIKDPSTLPALRDAMSARDPYLAQMAAQSVRRITNGQQ
jgi:HEAT repeat protein